MHESQAGASGACRDNFVDVRSAPDTAVAVDYNGGFSGALLLLASKQWEPLCLGRPGLIDRVGAGLPHSVW
jgi:hypothetical protein